MKFFISAVDCCKTYDDHNLRSLYFTIHLDKLRTFSRSSRISDAFVQALQQPQNAQDMTGYIVLLQGEGGGPRSMYYEPLTYKNPEAFYQLNHFRRSPPAVVFCAFYVIGKEKLAYSTVSQLGCWHRLLHHRRWVVGRDRPRHPQFRNGCKLHKTHKKIFLERQRVF